MNNVVIDFEVIIYTLFIAVFLFFVLSALARYSKQMMYIVAYIVVASVMGLGYNIHDYDIYSGLYDASKNFELGYVGDIQAASWYGFAYDYGFTILNSVGNYVGLSYAEFKFISESLVLAAMFVIIARTVKSAQAFALVISLYVIFPLWDDTVQIRNFYVEIVFFMAFMVYVKSTRLRTLKYTIVMLIGTAFHSIAWVYVPFAFIKKNQYMFNRLYKLFIYIGLALPFYALYLTDVISPFIMLFLSTVSGLPDSFTGHYMGYLGESMGFGWLIPYGYCVVLAFCMHKYLPIIEERYQSRENNYAIIYLKALLAVSLFMCIYLPIQPFTSNLMRIPRNTLLLYYVGFGLSYRVLNIKEKFIACFVLIACAYWIGLSDFFVKTNNSSEGFYLVLENNFLINFLFGE